MAPERFLRPSAPAGVVAGWAHPQNVKSVKKAERKGKAPALQAVRRRVIGPENRTRIAFRSNFSPIFIRCSSFSSIWWIVGQKVDFQSSFVIFCHFL